MNDQLSNYFKNFNEQLTDDLGSRFDYASLLAYGKRKKGYLLLDTSSLEFPWIDDVEAIVEKIKEIVEAVNPSINPDLDFERFEDRFIVFLIDQLASLLAVTTSNITSSTRSLGDFFIGRYISLQGMKNLNGVQVLNKSTKLYLEEQRKLSTIRETLGNLMETNYYVVLKRSVNFNEKCVCINSVIANNPLYGDCYEFFKELDDIRALHYDLPLEARNIDYHSYVLVNLLLELSDMGFELNGESPNFDNKDYLVKVKNLKLLRKDMFVYVNTDSDDHIDLLFEMNDNNIRKTKKQSKVSIDLYPSLNRELPSKEEASSYLNMKAESRCEKGYDNAFVITSIAGSQNDHVIISSPIGNPLDANIRNMIESCLVSFPVDFFTYERFCPICGMAGKGEDEDGNHVCPVCGSKYTLLRDKDKKEIVWVKRLENLEGK